MSVAEETVYRWLVVHPGSTASEVAGALGQTRGTAQRLLDKIEMKGLATHSPERIRCYLPTSPDIAIEAMIIQRQKDFQRVRDLVQELQEQASVQRQTHQERMVEMITSPEAERQIFENIPRTALHEVNGLVRPPVRVSRLSEAHDYEPQRAAQARGVKYRSIVDSGFLSLPDALASVRSDVASGEEIRVLSELPFKMVLADHKIALIPLNLQQSDSPSLLVRSSALLDALYALFDILWKQASPFTLTRDGQANPSAPSDLPEGTNELLALMAAGLNDKKIAAEMGMSASTLTRRISEIMHAFNARNRFQLARLTERR